ncbi:MAG: fused MFS/spermidine synthase [Acidobacteriota bacterium]
MSARLHTALFTLTLFLGSVLLFWLEPMFGRLLLPRLGGAPAVWNTCLVFFQVMLLAGYLYAWASSRWLSSRMQIGLHLALLVAAFVVLPVRVVPGWAPPAEANPIPWLLGMLGVSIGLPFLVVSTTAPVLQHWFAASDHPESQDPYFLYQASNLGSMAALVAYPALIEPWLGLKEQSGAWTAAYVAFGLLCGLCAAIVIARPGTAGAAAETPAIRKIDRRAARQQTSVAPDAARGRRPADGGRIGPTRLLRWTALAAVPSSLLLGVTTYLSTDVAVVPLLWVIPLLLYLLTFVVAFARRPLVSLHAAGLALPMLLLPLVVIIIMRTAEPPWLVVPLHLMTFAAAAMVCHAQLASDRPGVTHLTLFYLCLSLGGALGGLFNALVAPLIFNVPLEYQLALVAACFFKPYRDATPEEARPTWQDVLLPVALGSVSLVLFWAVARGGSAVSRFEIPLAFGIPLLAGYAFSFRPVRFALGVAAILLASLVRPDPFGKTIDVERSFFGVHRVIEDSTNHMRLLFHGLTLHGVQSLEPGRSREPLAYYTRSGPVGELLATRRRVGPRSVGLVGLGAGAIAAFSQPGETWTFYEIDPIVVRLARDAGYFSYLRDAPGRVDVVVGDARLSLARHATPRFDILVLDAFSSDAVPVHLLTREAIQLYLSKLNQGGVLAFHSSSRFLTLRRELLALANDAGLSHLRWLDTHKPDTKEHWTGWTPSEWVLMARNREDFAPLTADDRWGVIPDEPARVWTDDYSNLLALFRWR